MPSDNLKGASILGLFIFLGLAFLGYFLGTSAITFKEYERTVTAKGLSEREYPADIAIWPIPYSRAHNNQHELYTALESDAQAIIAFLLSHGFEASEITTNVPSVMDRLAQGFDKNDLEFRYFAEQTLTVYSKKIEQVRTTMNKLIDLGKQGITFTANNFDHRPQYLFTRLNEVKPEMVAESTRKAREVGEKFAKDSKSNLGKIKRARQGQFSIRDRDSNNPHIKIVRVVSTVEYYLSD
jgi:hypothetical protein